VAYAIRFSDEAEADLASLTARRRATLVDGVTRQLTHEPTVETRNRKRMQESKRGFVAPWELRIGDLRVYYDVMTAPEAVVVIVAVGVKVRSRVRIGRREFDS